MFQNTKNNKACKQCFQKILHTHKWVEGGEKRKQNQTNKQTKKPKPTKEEHKLFGICSIVKRTKNWYASDKVSLQNRLIIPK